MKKQNGCLPRFIGRHPLGLPDISLFFRLSRKLGTHQYWGYISFVRGLYSRSFLYSDSGLNPFGDF